MNQMSKPNAAQEKAIKIIFSECKDFSINVDFSKVYKDYVKSHHTDNTNEEDTNLSVFNGWLNGKSIDNQEVKDIIRGIVQWGYDGFYFDSSSGVFFLKKNVKDFRGRSQEIDKFLEMLRYEVYYNIREFVIGKDVTELGTCATNLKEGLISAYSNDLTIKFEEGRKQPLEVETNIVLCGSNSGYLHIHLPSDTKFYIKGKCYGVFITYGAPIEFDYYSTMQGNITADNLFNRTTSNTYTVEKATLKNLTINLMDHKIGGGFFIGCSINDTCILNGFNNVVEIGFNAFFEAEVVNKDFVLPNNLEILGDKAFYMFMGFKNGIVCLPKTLHRVGKEVFKYCKDLKRIECTWQQRTLLKSNNCVDKGVEIAVSDFEVVKEIDADTFADESIVNCDFTLPEKLEKIGDRAFKGFTGFKNGMICLPETVSEIGKEVFIGCSDLKCIECTWKQSMILKNNNCVDKGVKFHLTDKHSYSTEKIIDDVKLNEGANVVELFIDDMDLLIGIIIESGNRNVFTSVHSMSEDIVYINCFNLSKEMLDVSLKCKLTFSN